MFFFSSDLSLLLSFEIKDGDRSEEGVSSTSSMDSSLVPQPGDGHSKELKERLEVRLLVELVCCVFLLSSLLFRV